MFRAPAASGGGGGGGAASLPLTSSITTQSPNPVEMGDQSHHRAAARAFQFHPARPAIIDLFNLYLGVCFFPNFFLLNLMSYFYI